MRKLLLALLFPALIGAVSTNFAHAAEDDTGVVTARQKEILASCFTPEQLRAVLVPLEKWRPFPPVNDRAAWAKADPAILAACVAEGEKRLAYKWPTIPATLSLEVMRTGNRSNFESISFEKRRVLAHLVLAEIAEDKGRFMDAIANGIWSICEESWWGSPAHLPRNKDTGGLHDITRPSVDLFTATTAEMLAWTDYFLGEKLDALSPLLRKRIRLEVERRVFQPVLAHRHWWMGEKNSTSAPNNWNPWICSNWLAAALLLIDDDATRARHAGAVLDTLDNFLDHYPADGGCDEGPNYWNAAAGSLYDNLALLNSATNDAFAAVLQNDKIKNMAKFIYRGQISEKYVVNFADASPRIGIDSALVYRFGKDVNDPAMRGFAAAYLADKNRRPLAGLINHTHFARTFFYLFSRNEIEGAEKALPLPAEVWLPDLQVMIARDTAGAATGFFVAAKGGHNNESHNHNDVGSFIVYHDGLPVLIDVGSGKYTAKTFGGQRYTIWNMRSEYHNAPTINGAVQSAGAKFRARNAAFKNGPGFSELTLDIAGAYPPGAAVKSWERGVRLNRGKSVVVRDTYALEKNAAPLVEHLMTCQPVQVTGENEVTIFPKDENGKDATPLVVRLTGATAAVSIEKIKLEGESDSGVLRNWGDTLSRVNFTLTAPPATGVLTLTVAPQ